MKRAESDGRVRWVVPALIAAVAIVLLVVLSTPPELTLPEGPDEQLRSAGPGDTAVPELPGLDHHYSGRIDGRVLRDGQGVAAKLTLQVFKRFPGRLLRQGRADTSGFFTFEGVPPGTHEISAIGPGGIRVRRSVTVPAGVDPRFVELTLPCGGLTLRGRAIHANGRPFSGEVEVHRGAGSDLLSAPTRADGRFTIPGLAAGRISPYFRSGRAFYAQGRFIKLPAEDEVLFVVDEGAQKIRGRVFESASGDPVAGAEVEIWSHGASAGNLSLRVKSGADGRFRAAVLMADGRVRDLIVNAEGFRPWRLTRIPVTEDIEIGLEPSARLTVRVVAADGGAPVPFVPVKATYRSLPDVNDSETLLTDRHGRVTFSSISGDTVRLSVRGHGYITDDLNLPEERRFFILSSGEEREVELPVSRSVVLMGTVTTAAGDPVVGGWVGYKTSGISGNKSLRQGHEFILEDLLPGDFRLRASRRGLKGEEITGTLAPGEVRRLDLPLGAGAWVLAEVRGADTGRPLEGAFVTLSRCGKGRTDAAGQVRFGPFEAESKDAKVWCEGYCVLRQKVECPVGRTTALVVSLSRGMSLGGTVLLADGTPASGAMVRLSGQDVWSYRLKTRAGEDGSFLLRGLPSCLLTLAAGLRDAAGRYHRGHQVLRTGITDTILVLERMEVVQCPKVRVQVTDGAGAPVPKASFEVLALDAAGEILDLDSGEIVNGRGEFEIDPDVTDTVLYVHGARRPSSIPLPSGDAVFGPYPASMECIEVVLPAGLVITGKVLDPERQGMPGVEIRGSRTWWPGLELSHRFPWYARTAPDGSFEIGGLGPGMVTLEVLVPKGEMQVDPVVVSAGERGVVIRLVSLVSVEVTVRDRQGRPVKKGFVEVWNQARIEGGGSWSVSEESGSTNGEGRTRLTDLPATARYILIVRDYGTSDLAPVRIDGWVPRDTEVSLPPGRSISGRALRPDGTPELGEKGSVWAWGRAKGWGLVSMHPGGVFREEGFAEGRVALIWIPDGIDAYDDLVCEPEKYDWPITWVRAGDRDIVFRRSSR